MRFRAKVSAVVAVCGMFSVAASGCPWGGPRPKPPATTTTTTSTGPPAITTTTTTMVMPTTTLPAPTTVPAGAAFFDDLSSDASMALYDFGWSGEVQAGAGFGAAKNDWPMDHDMACGDPRTTNHAVHVTPPADEYAAPAGSVKDVSQAFMRCDPSGDPANGHLMTSVNTEGYVVAWFSPKRVFTDVRRVCWDQSTSDLGGGKWQAVAFLTEPEFTRLQKGMLDLGFTTPEFPNTGGPSTPQGTAQFGVRMGRGTDAALESWANGQFTGGIVHAIADPDRRPRYQHCVTDNENGTLSVSIGQKGAPPATGTIPGSIPNGKIRVVFEDDNYNPDKHYNLAGTTPDQPFYTVHWDRPTVEVW